MQKKYIQNEKADILTFGNNDKQEISFKKDNQLTLK